MAAAPSTGAGPEHPGEGAGPPVAADATRRTYLANERTFLAWFRTALALLAIAITVGRVLPEVADTHPLPFQIVGMGFGLLGLFTAIFGGLRERRVDRALATGDYVPLPTGAVGVLVASVLVLGVSLLVLVWAI